MRRLLNLVFVVAAVACFFLCAYGLYWMWSIKKPAIASASSAFQQADKYLEIADGTISEVKGNLEVSRLRMSMIPRSDIAMNAVGGPGFLESMVARTVVGQVAPGVDNIQNVLQQVAEASIVANSILESLPTVAIDSFDRIDVDSVRNLQTQIAGVSKASWELGELLDSPRPGDNESPAAKSERIAANIAQIIQMTDEFQKRVQALRQRVDRFQKTTLYWLKVGPIYITIFLSWVMFSQILVVVLVVKDSRQ